jgi:hypothetical protein
MKRREFINAAASLTAIGLLPGTVFSQAVMAAGDFTVEAYDDNKVVRVYDRKISNYAFSEDPVFWKTIDRSVLKDMLSKSLSEISGEKGEAKGWKKIFAGDRKADLSAKKVVIKVNFNNTIRDIHVTLNNSPAMMAVLTGSMLKAGLREENICFFDCSRPFPEEFKNEVRALGLHKVEMKGKNDELPVSNKTIFLSDNKGFLRDGKPTDQYPIPQVLMDADYLVNLHLVKMHSTGVTGAMKNLFGISKEVGFYMHQKGPKNFPESNHLPDISLNEEIKKRARLNISEFIFGGHTPDSIDKFTNEAFFPGGMPASLIVSRSPFYHDTVLYSFIKAEYATCDPEKLRKDLKTVGPDTWLKNSSNRYPAWKYDQAKHIELAKEGRPKKDLSFSNVNYRTI